MYHNHRGGGNTGSLLLKDALLKDCIAKLDAYGENKDGKRVWECEFYSDGNNEFALRLMPKWMREERSISGIVFDGYDCMGLYVGIYK